MLIFDNRGMGESDKPLIRYSTSEMAKDAVELFDHLGWTRERELHIIGISMGGMISQELVISLPSSVFLLSVTANVCLGPAYPAAHLHSHPRVDSSTDRQYRRLH